MQHFRLSLTAVLSFLLLAAPLSLMQPLAAQSAEARVSIANFDFSPGRLTIPAGTTVVWRNNDSVVHTVTSTTGDFDSGNLAFGETFQFTFNTPGSFNYFCEIHPSMRGQIVVTAQSPDAQEFALIHSLDEGQTYPDTLIVTRGVPVRLFNTATDGTHPTVTISQDQAGRTPVFGVEPFEVEVGTMTTVEFTPDRTGTFFITHRLHGHPIVGKLVVE